jgi:hypothetical protein
MNANSNLLGYRRHQSVCYTRLFTTPLVVITISLLQWVLTPWCLVSERSFDVFCLPNAGSWLTDSYRSRSRSHIATDGQSVISLGVEPHLGLMTRYILLFDNYGLAVVGRPLWREDGSVFCMCRWPLPAQYFSGPSPLGLETVFYCLRFETFLFVALHWLALINWLSPSIQSLLTE